MKKYTLIISALLFICGCIVMALDPSIATSFSEMDIYDFVSAILLASGIGFVFIFNIIKNLLK